MGHTRRRTLLELGMYTDLTITGAALLSASALLCRPLWDEPILTVRHPVSQLVRIAFLMLCWHGSLVATGAYTSHRAAPRARQTATVALGATLCTWWTCLWLCLEGFTRSLTMPRLLAGLVVFWWVSFCGMLLMRLIARTATTLLRRRGRNMRNVLIVGSNRRAVALAERLARHEEFGYRLVGFVDDFWHFDAAPEAYKAMLLGGSDHTLELLRTLALDEVIIALPIASKYKRTGLIIDWCREQGILVRSEGSLFDPESICFPGGSAVRLITLHDSARDGWAATMKRAVDICASGSMLLIALPIFIGIALGIKLTSRGPVMFGQERLGLNKRRFRILKFRTMVLDAEKQLAKLEHLNESAGPTFKLRDDPRVTRFGSFLRRSSLDELPQLINVLLGDMSLVGPRPLPLRDYEGFSKDWHRRRFSVKPGITCLWQVMGRSAVGFERWMELDLHYIDQWSLWLDLKILLEQAVDGLQQNHWALSLDQDGVRSACDLLDAEDTGEQDHGQGVVELPDSGEDGVTVEVREMVVEHDEINDLTMQKIESGAA